MLGSAMEGLAFSLCSGCGFPLLGSVIEMQLGETSRHLHKAASDYLVSASITINFMWRALLSNSSFFQTDFLNVIGHGAVCDFMSAQSNPFHPCGCLCRRMYMPVACVHTLFCVPLPGAHGSPAPASSQIGDSGAQEQVLWNTAGSGAGL